MQGYFRDITERKTAEKLLEKKQHELNLIFDSSPILIFFKDREGKFKQVNRAYVQALRVPKKKLLGKTVFDFYSAEIAEGLTKDDHAVLESKLPKLGIIGQYPSPSGLRWVKTDKIPIFDENGVLNGLVGFSEDVTECKTAEAALRDSEEKFRNLAEQSPNIIFIHQKERIVYANPQAEEVMGYKKEEFISPEFNFRILIAPESLESAKAIFDRHKRGEEVVPCEFRMVKKDRTTLDVINNTRMIKYLGEPAILGVVTDITERKKDERNLRDSENKLKAIVEASPEPIIISSSDAKIIDCNHAALKTFEYSEKSDVIGKNVFDFFAEKNRSAATDRLAKRAEVRNEEYIFQAKDGREFPGELSTNVVYRRSGEANLFVSIVRDISERKEGEEKLKDLAMFPSENPNPVMRVAKDSTILYLNDSAKLLFKNLKVGSPALAELNKIIKDVFKDSLKRNIEANVGQQAFHFTIFPFLDRGYANVYGLDITERKKAELDLKKSEEKYRNIFDNSGVGMFRTRSDGSEILDCNSKFLEVFGRTREEMVGNPSVICWADPLERQEMVCLLHVRGQVNDFECKMLNKEGEIKTCLTSVILYPEQEILEGTLIDITERKKAEEWLNLSEKRARAIVENSPIGIATSGPDKRFLSANTEFCKILGFTEEELRKLTFKDITVPEDLNESVTNMALLEAGELSSFNQEKRYLRKDGKVINGKISVSAIRDRDGKPTLFVAELEDITEKKKMQTELFDYSHNLEKLVEARTEQLKETQEKLVKAERLAAIGELAGMVGHDLRNPLTGIKNAAYFLEKKNDLISKTQKQEMFDVINRCIDHSNKIINDLLDYSRDIYPELKENSLTYLLNEALSFVKVPASVKVTRNVSDNLKLNVDGNKMSRVFVNLIQNAIDAMPDGGKISIFAKKEDDNMSISISDTGVGIPDEVLSKLFTPLVTSKAQGMGFGLAICKRIVDAHCGKITVKTAKGEGTTFTVTLPVEPKIEFGCGKFLINMPESRSLKMKKT